MSDHLDRNANHLLHDVWPSRARCLTILGMMVSILGAMHDHLGRNVDHLADVWLLRVQCHLGYDAWPVWAWCLIILNTMSGHLGHNLGNDVWPSWACAWPSWVWCMPDHLGQVVSAILGTMSDHLRHKHKTACLHAYMLTVLLSNSLRNID
jgi:hypothetical protein